MFGYLASTRLPVVSSLSAMIRWLSLGLAALCGVYGVACLVIPDGGLWSPRLPWSGALPALLASPLFFGAWVDWRQNRMQRAATTLFVAMFAFTILANWPRGAFSPAWYLQPVLSLLSTMCLGVVPGLLLTLVAAGSLLAAAYFVPGDPSPQFATDRWVHSASLAAVTLASALAGAIVNRLVFMALMTAEAQRRKNFESSRALRYREKLLRHALRVETVGDLAGMVCHQLRNTFQVLLGHATIGGMSDDGERVRRLQLIEDTLQHSRPLLDQLMHLAHPDEGTTTACDIASVLRSFHEQARLVLPTSIQITCEAPAEVPAVLLNPHGLVHSLWNLTINSKQAIREQGAIALRCGSDRHQVWVEIADTGCGMTQEVQLRIFDPYFTTKPAGQGTGLGLTAVARFVHSSNGLIQVESAPDRGTTFRLRFPRLQDVRLSHPA